MNVSPTAADYKVMGRGKVGTERFQMFWPSIQPGPGSCTAALGSSCDWGPIDGLVQGAAKRGIRALPYFYGTPGWASGRGGDFADRYSPMETQAGKDGWKALLTAAAERYGPNGLFWQEHPELPDAPVKDWQIWNEQNSANRFKPRPSPGAYAKLLKVSSASIKAVSPSADVIVGGMFGTPGAGGSEGKPAWNYIKGLFKVNGVSDAADSVALHPYSPGIRGVKYQLEKIRDALKTVHSPSTRIWVTELGWGSDAKHVKHPLVKTPSEQAKLLKESFQFLVDKRKSWNIAGLTWFDWRDPSSTVGQCAFCLSAGLVEKNLDPKPAWKAFTQFTGGKP